MTGQQEEPAKGLYVVINATNSIISPLSVTSSVAPQPTLLRGRTLWGDLKASKVLKSRRWQV